MRNRFINLRNCVHNSLKKTRYNMAKRLARSDFLRPNNT